MGVCGVYETVCTGQTALTEDRQRTHATTVCDRSGVCAVTECKSESHVQ